MHQLLHLCKINDLYLYLHFPARMAQVVPHTGDLPMLHPPLKYRARAPGVPRVRVYVYIYVRIRHGTSEALRCCTVLCIYARALKWPAKIIGNKLGNLVVYRILMLSECGNVLPEPDHPHRTVYKGKWLWVEDHM